MPPAPGVQRACEHGVGEVDDCGDHDGELAGKRSGVDTQAATVGRVGARPGGGQVRHCFGQWPKVDTAMRSGGLQRFPELDAVDVVDAGQGPQVGVVTDLVLAWPRSTAVDTFSARTVTSG